MISRASGHGRVNQSEGKDDEKDRLSIHRKLGKKIPLLRICNGCDDKQ